MSKFIYLTGLLAFGLGCPLAAKPPSPGSLEGATGGGRPSNGGGAVPPSTRPAGGFSRLAPAGFWLGRFKGDAIPGTGVDRTKAGFGGIAPNDLGPAVRPDAGLGNPSRAAVRPDAGLGNPGTPMTRPDDRIGISRVPDISSRTRFTPSPVARRDTRPGAGSVTRITTVFPGWVKMRGIVNPGWAKKADPRLSPHTSALAVAKGTRFAPGTTPAAPTTTAVKGTPRPRPLTRPAVGTTTVPRPMPGTSIESPTDRGAAPPATTPPRKGKGPGR